MPRILSIVLGAIALIAAVVGIRSLMSGDDSVAHVPAIAVPVLDKALPGEGQPHGGTVEFTRSRAEFRTLFLKLGARSAAEVAPVAFGSAGKVTSLPVAEGAIVEAGALLCGLEGDGSGARVRQAETALARAREAHKQNTEWVTNGWVSPARVKQSKATLDEAQAALEVARNEVAQRQAVAPFRGVFEKRNATMGQFVQLGSSCGVVVRLDPITFVAGAPERQAVRIKAGAPVRVKLPTGREVAGQVEKISSVADPQTRNFEVKVTAPNGDNAIQVGGAAELRINVGMGKAHRISESLLKADAVGRIGVYFLDVGGVIGFAPAEIVDDAVGHVWVTGLADDAQLVSAGQDNIVTGMRVTPVVREAPATGGG